MDRPILFSAPMVRAFLDGHKTQTRRLAWRYKIIGDHQDMIRLPAIWQKVEPGDRLWVRESCALPDAGRSAVKRLGLRAVVYKADEGVKHGRLKQYDGRWKASIHMPRWASRLTLVVTKVRRQRVQEISMEDAKAEGAWTRGNIDRLCDQHGLPAFEANPIAAFCMVWKDLHGQGAWQDNPEVVALTFTVHQTNIDETEQAA